MNSTNILFLGSKEPYSQKVRISLKQAGHHIYKGHTLKGCDPCIDLIVVASYGKIIPQKTLDLPKHGALNIHPSLLPKYRGATPVPRTILSGDTKTGVTIFKMDSGIDTGPILAQQSTLIKPNETSKDLLNRLFQIGSDLLVKTLPGYIEGKITPKPQPKKSPTPYAKKFTKQDGFISFNQFIKLSQTNFTSIDHKIRALYPWPGVWTKLPNRKVIKLLPHGKLQLEGKAPISWQAFSNGYKHLLK